MLKTTPELIPFLGASLVIDWNEIAAANGTIDPYKVELIFKSGAKTILDLEELVAVRPLLELQNFGG